MGGAEDDRVMLAALFTLIDVRAKWSNIKLNGCRRPTMGRIGACSDMRAGQ